MRADGGGRVVAMGVMRNNAALANVIRTGAWQQIQSMIETQGKDGAMSLDRHLARLVQAGRITREEALKNGADPGLAQRV